MAPGIHQAAGGSGEEKRKRIFAVSFLILLASHAAYSQEPQQEYEQKSQEESPQESPPEIEPPIFRFELSTRFQTVDLDTGSSKATEYRSLPEGLYIDNLLLYYGSQRQELRGEVVRFSPLTNLINDGYGDVTYRRYGLLSAGAGVSKSPHDYGVGNHR